MKKLFTGLIFLAYLAMLGVYLNYWVKPEQLYFLSFLGLGYVFVLIAFLIALVVAFNVSKKYFFYGIGVFLLGVKLHFNFFSVAIPNDSISDKSLKVVSYNVRLFDLYSNPDGSVKQKMFTYLKEQQADIYCFQEFYQQDPPTKFVTLDSLKLILQTPNIQEHYSFHLRGRQYFGVCMMTRFPVVAQGDVSFEDDTHESNNYCIYMDIVPQTGDTIRVYNIHLQSIKLNNSDISGLEDETKNPPQTNWKGIVKKLHLAFERRQYQTEKVISHIQESPYRVIIMGDFNDTPMSYSYLQFRKILKDAFTSNCTGIGATYAGKLPVGRIDYILHSDALNPYDFTIQKEAYSDHYALSCRFNY
ncbi:MAG TPA: endonuclease/exonuclease/phosphatase family protein [Crocinitomicaceae bacterium]|nr:endonuclease/exonuclease/phosphatase family protein [Crocinitomicaceae bacterium]